VARERSKQTRLPDLRDTDAAVRGNVEVISIRAHIPSVGQFMDEYSESPSPTRFGRTRVEVVIAQRHARVVRFQAVLARGRAQRIRRHSAQIRARSRTLREPV
jgi:hypothetical protein